VKYLVLIVVIAIGLFGQVGFAQVPGTTSTSTPIAQPPSPDRSSIEIPPVDFCDLVQRPAEFDGQIIRTHAIWYSAFEGSALFLPACEKLDTWAEFDASYSGKSKPEKKLYKIFSRGNVGDVNQAEIVFVGRFTGKRQTFQIGKFAYSMGYGHMNMYPYLFTIMRVENAKVAHHY
jgi:hypothetical protein